FSPQGQPLPPDIISSLPAHAQELRAPTRRAFLAGGIAGLVATGGIATWLVLWRTQANTTRTGSLLHWSGGMLGHPPLSGQDTPEAVYRGHKGIVLLARWSLGGKYIATGSMDGTAQIWLAATRATKLSVRSTTQPPLSDDYPWSLSWSPSHPHHLAIGFADGTIQVLDTDGGQRLSLFNPSPTGARVIRVAWSPGERYLAVGGSDNLVRVDRYPGWEVVAAYGEHTNTITALAW